MFDLQFQIYTILPGITETCHPLASRQRIVDTKFYFYNNIRSCVNAKYAKITLLSFSLVYFILHGRIYVKLEGVVLNFV